MFWGLTTSKHFVKYFLESCNYLTYGKRKHDLGKECLGIWPQMLYFYSFALLPYVVQLCYVRCQFCVNVVQVITVLSFAGYVELVKLFLWDRRSWPTVQTFFCYHLVFPHPLSPLQYFQDPFFCLLSALWGMIDHWLYCVHVFKRLC